MRRPRRGFPGLCPTRALIVVILSLFLLLVKLAGFASPPPKPREDGLSSRLSQQSSPEKTDFVSSASEMKVPVDNAARMSASNPEAIKTQSNNIATSVSTTTTTTTTTITRKEAIVTAGPEKTLTFEYFLGRLSNQLWTLDWVFRLGLALNRTVVIPEFTDSVCYIGLPRTQEEEALGLSLWDLQILSQSPFKLDLYSGTKGLPPPEAACIFSESKHGKYLVHLFCPPFSFLFLNKATVPY